MPDLNYKDDVDILREALHLRTAALHRVTAKLDAIRALVAKVERSTGDTWGVPYLYANQIRRILDDNVTGVTPDG